MSNEKDMHKTGWANIDLPPHLNKAREEQEKEISKKKVDTHPFVLCWVEKYQYLFTDGW